MTGWTESMVRKQYTPQIPFSCLRILFSYANQTIMFKKTTGHFRDSTYPNEPSVERRPAIDYTEDWNFIINTNEANGHKQCNSDQVNTITSFSIFSFSIFVRTPRKAKMLI